MKNLYFFSLGSGSTGNCYYIGTDEYGFLIDAGISSVRIKRYLKKHNIPFSNIKGIFITHNHTDHVKYAGILNSKYEIPIYTTKRIFWGILRNRNVKNPPTFCNFIHKEESFSIKDFTILPFPVSHDSTECIGFTFYFLDKTFTIATDLGYINDITAKQILSSNYLVIESNYDEKMLENGPYPEILKNRIKSPQGHLCNNYTADFLAKNWNDNLKYIFLCHLSAENNTPQLAYQTIFNKLKSENITPHFLAPLDRLTPSELFIL